MEEGNVTVDGVTRKVPSPFVVIATENPVGSIGTQLLPESQLDRFMICMTMGYPDGENEIAIAKGKSKEIPINQIEGIIPAEELIEIKKVVDEVYLRDELYEYIVKLVQATRDNDLVELGVSPRGTIALVRMAKAMAFLDGRDYVVPQDVQAVFEAVTGHRIVLNAKARVGHVSVKQILHRIMDSVKEPKIRE